MDDGALLEVFKGGLNPMTQSPIEGQASLVDRARNILFSPRAEWARIDGERATVRSIYVPYVLALAAIGPLAMLIGGQVFGYGAFGVHFRPTLISGLVTAVVGYGLALAGVFVLALVIEALASSFGGTRDRIQALKVAAYASTAAWLAGIFQIFPQLAMLGILGLYSLYLLYLGLPVLMKAPADKALGYTVVTVIVAIVLWIVIGALTTAVTGTLTRGANMGGAFGSGAATVTLPGGERVETRGLEDAARRMEEASARIAEGRTTPVAAPADLAALLPASVAGLNRVSLESETSGVEGMSASAAEAVYERGDARITLTVADLGDMAVLGNLAGALGVLSSREDDDGYERIGRVDGRMTKESWNRLSRQGEYSVMVADRMQVQAEGSNVDMDDLRAAVNGVDFRRLERMAR